jgi:hypothetical protein
MVTPIFVASRLTNDTTGDFRLDLLGRVAMKVQFTID